MSRVAITSSALLLALAACDGKAAPEEVEAACRHQLSVATWTGYEVRLEQKGVTPTSVSGEEWQRIRTEAQADIDARMASDEGRLSLAKCVEVYSRLPSSRIECILEAHDAATINGCLPQADKLP